jgi:ATP-dependent DNA helicase
VQRCAAQNPQVDLQAMDRCHRIGQTKPVLVYRLITRGSVEERMLAKAQERRKLEKLVINKKHFKGGHEGVVLDLNDIKALLSEKDQEEVCTHGDMLGCITRSDVR